MNKYSELISDAINKSGLKLNKIAELVETITGNRPTKEYLSRLQNGRVPPGGDRLNDALAEVLNIDPLYLKAAAYQVKIPEEVLEKLIEITA